ncbi:hypothetical protein CDL60_14425 [Roseateles noduli]|nr:hypothetical protein CDL60_14425 [Roseateles noduli]
MNTQEFFEWQPIWDDLHELIDGVPRPVRASGPAFLRVVVNLSSTLKRHLRDTEFTTLIRGQALRVDDQNVLYPDLFVAEDSEDCWAPRLVAAVIPPSDHASSARPQIRAAQDVKSVQEILLVNVRERCIELHRRVADAAWTTQVVEADETVALSSLNVHLPATAVFDQLDRPEPALTSKEFLDWVKDEEFRLEFYEGRIVRTDGSMGGHLRAIVQIQLALRTRLEAIDRRIDYVDHPEARTDLDEPFFFDIGLFARHEEAAAVRDLSQPDVLIEAHSGTIGRRDRVTRLRERLQRPSLMEYIQIDCHRRRMTVHRRAADGTWRSVLMSEGAPLEVATIGASVPAETVFRRI